MLLPVLAYHCRFSFVNDIYPAVSYYVEINVAVFIPLTPFCDWVYQFALGGQHNRFTTKADGSMTRPDFWLSQVSARL